MDDEALQQQVVARSQIGTAFYLFHHQAGGHKPFLRSARGEVCKPAIALELQFYRTLEARYPQLKPFVPPFVGVIVVELHPIEHGEPSSDVTASGASQPTERVVSQAASDQRAHPVSAPPNASANARKLKRHSYASPTASQSPARALFTTASYSAKLWKEEQARGALSRGVDSHDRPHISQEYLVLGDLTVKYSRPSVLDIKMGTRQHGADASPAKVLSHTAKCAATTSLALGMRICGMQVYDEIEQKYSLWDKHWGRQLTVDDIEQALTTYFSSSAGVHWNALKALRDKLERLKGAITRTTGVRFWGSSLLLIYEGDLRNASPREDVRLIDFAHCQMDSELTNPDEGLLLGLENMIFYLSKILDNRTGMESIE